jgi:hypothetical protein
VLRMLPSYRYLRTDPIWLITQKMLLLAIPLFTASS